MSAENREWATLITLLRPERTRLLIAMALAVAAVALELWPYWLLYRAAAVVLAGNAVASQLTGLAGWLTLALVGKYAAYTLAGYLSHYAAYRLLFEIRRNLVRRIASIPLTRLQAYTTGTLKKIVFQDVERLELFIAHHTIELVAAVLGPLFVGILLFWVDWRMALAALSTVPLAIAVQAVLFRDIGERIDEYNQAVADLNGATVEYVRSMPVMKAFRQTAGSFRAMNDSLERYRHLVSDFTRQAVPGWSAFMVLLGANITVVLPVGLWLNLHGALTVPELILCLMAGSGLLRPLFKVMHFASLIREILGGVRRIQPLLVSAPSDTRTATDPPVRHDVTFDGVRFGYGARNALEAVSFRLPEGRMTALVGPSGAGKTTVVNLLGGLQVPDQGEIRIGDVPLARLSEAQRTRLVAVVPQEAFLFRGTLLDNLRLGRPNATDAEVQRAAGIAQADQFIRDLPEGYFTRVEEQGVRLSGGERQRIAIARALLADTPILVLDEATAFADTLTEQAFYRALRRAYPDKTVLVVAHRLYAVDGADQVLVLDDGGLTDAGGHSELLERCPLYRELWESQFESHAWQLRTEEESRVGIH
ncbi:ABC transporter ATP-binding protein [Arhodomonas sp. AD133]|uniref:ABC transporter ATP-binding protein n=1 Tax=Arhodomonas sp. AD133 TaxID=3415009 RepID=UPI003EBB52F4